MDFRAVLHAVEHRNILPLSGHNSGHTALRYTDWPQDDTCYPINNIFDLSSGGFS
jgi:hypothetical protein